MSYKTGVLVYTLTMYGEFRWRRSPTTQHVIVHSTSHTAHLISAHTVTLHHYSSHMIRTYSHVLYAVCNRLQLFFVVWCNKEDLNSFFVPEYAILYNTEGFHCEHLHKKDILHNIP